jgi:putative protease
VIRPELLAPAGDFASLDAALNHGADAVYAGIGTLNLRAHAPNFTLNDLPELLNRVHSLHRRLYLTFNIIPDDAQLDAIDRILAAMAAASTFPDAFIVSDPGVISLCRERAPSVDLHLSTQTAGAFNRRSLSFWKNLGITRVVLPRELTMDRINALAAADLLETELFIHGAMCVSISGRCLMGAYMSGRHPNHGDCPQPCRWRYRISAVPAEGTDSEGELPIDVEEDATGTYLFNSRDLCTIDLLPSLIASGVTSFKIEGRNKSAHYVAAVVKAYRAAIDRAAQSPRTYRVDDQWRFLLDSVEHRPYTAGFYNRELVMQEVFSSKATAATRIVGIVKALLPDGLPVVDVKNGFSADEPLDVLPVQQYREPAPFTCTHITDLSGNPINRAPSNRLAVLHGTGRMQPGDMLRRRETGTG